MSKELQRSELEVKFECGELALEEFTTFMAEQFHLSTRQYHKVDGWDAYYVHGENVVRHRCDGRRKRSVLTVKQRKSADSLMDRHEIDMPVGDQVSADEVEAFLLMTGWKHLFTINKESFIYHIEQIQGNVCVALYDVWRKGEDRKSHARRFLEIEIEKDSNMSIDEARDTLGDWKSSFQTAFGFDEPLNQSLYEMYRPGDNVSI